MVVRVITTWVYCTCLALSLLSSSANSWVHVSTTPRSLLVYLVSILKLFLAVAHFSILSLFAEVPVRRTQGRYSQLQRRIVGLEIY